jgi:hypothetical protein
LNANSRLGEYFEMHDMPRHKRKPLRQAYHWMLWYQLHVHSLFYKPSGH